MCVLDHCVVASADQDRRFGRCKAFHRDSAERIRRTCLTFKMAPGVGFEPTTNRLTADRSTTELPWIFLLLSVNLVRAIHSGQVLPTAFLKNQSKHENRI